LKYFYSNEDGHAVSDAFGGRWVFMLTGGGAMFLNHAIGNTLHIQTVFNYHEQACAMAVQVKISKVPVGVWAVGDAPGTTSSPSGNGVPSSTKKPISTNTLVRRMLIAAYRNTSTSTTTNAPTMT